jgi:putative intracellular protease/amidase
MKNILFILTSYDRLLNGEKTGVWLEEHAVPYRAITGAGHRVTVASVSGGAVPVDPKSQPSADQATLWADAAATLAATPAFNTLDADSFDAVYMPGGHGTMFDMPFNAGLHRLLLRFEDSGRVIASVCHAPAVFGGFYRADGTPFVAGRTLAAFTNSEEAAAGGTDKVPFLLETRLKDLGATHSPAPNWSSHAVQDGKLITGQNPQSSGAVAEKLLASL